MRNETREKFTEYTGQLAKLNSVTSAMMQFSVEPSVQQTLETKMQESTVFLGMINMLSVQEIKGQKVGIGIGSTIAGRTDTGTKDRQPNNPTALYAHSYECAQTDFDTMIGYGQLDAWAKFPDFQTRVRDAIITRQALDRIMIGWNGTHAAADTDRNANPLLQDVNIGWLEHIRQDAPAQVMSEGAPASGAIHIDEEAGDYTSLDS
ncbi:MAG: P2 family phage major capsid protein, partial [Aeromonas sp.]